MLMEEGKRVCEGNLVPGEVQRVGGVYGSASKGVVTVLSDCCSK